MISVDRCFQNWDALFNFCFGLSIDFAPSRFNADMYCVAIIALASLGFSYTLFTRIS